MIKAVDYVFVIHIRLSRLDKMSVSRAKKECNGSGRNYKIKRKKEKYNINMYRHIKRKVYSLCIRIRK